jgi:hypothetical protein
MLSAEPRLLEECPIRLHPAHRAVFFREHCFYVGTPNRTRAEPQHSEDASEEPKSMKAFAEQKAGVVQDERTREAEVASSLQAEQAKLNELEAPLDSLEKLIEPQRAQ